MTLRCEIAAQLLDRDEGGGVIGWARNLIATGKDAAHDGDCTNVSHACNRCIADRALQDADRLIAAVHGERTPVEETKP